MTKGTVSLAKHWYVLNYVSNPSHRSAVKEIETFNASSSCSLQLFAPTYVVKEERQGKIRMKTVKLTFHYVFVRGALSEIKKLCQGFNGFSFLIDHSSEERYAIVDDLCMTGFMNIARAYRNCLPYFSISDIDLEEGDVVEVVKGDFPGLIGTYIPRPKSNVGNIALHVYNNVGTLAFNVKASDVRVLEFAKDSTRANDQIDAFVPYLLSALRYYDCNEPLNTSLAAKLSTFCGRMEVAILRNRKLDARLQLLLYAANHIIGNVSQSYASFLKYEKIKNCVTNKWTRAVHDLVLSVINDRNKIISLWETGVKDMNPTSKTQWMIVDEYTYYLKDYIKSKCCDIEVITLNEIKEI